MLEVVLKSKNMSEVKNYPEEGKKICHQSLSMKVELESVLQEDHELLWRWEIILGKCWPILKI